MESCTVKKMVIICLVLIMLSSTAQAFSLKDTGSFLKTSITKGVNKYVVNGIADNANKYLIQKDTRITKPLETGLKTTAKQTKQAITLPKKQDTVTQNKQSTISKVTLDKPTNTLKKITEIKLPKPDLSKIRLTTTAKAETTNTNKIQTTQTLQNITTHNKNLSYIKIKIYTN